jgi:HPt (histidine-containing phosphotransfer) domain-containing protein
MNVFADSKRSLEPLSAEPPETRIAGIILLVSLLVGSALVIWHISADARRARATAAAWTQARAAAIELQLEQAASAVEALSALARQTGGAPFSFQPAAIGLLASRPGIATLEWQPGGIVKDVVPRMGNERVLGANILNDPGQRAAANAAIQQPAAVILGPAKLPSGEMGLVARASVFQKGRDGRESFSGLIAASIRLKDLAIRARLDDLWKEGYSYSLFVPAATRRSATGLLLRGEVSLGSAAQHPVKAHNLNLSLAVEPRDGWINKPRAALDIVLLLLVSGLFWVGARLLESKRAMGLELVNLQQRAEHDSRQRQQAEEESEKHRRAAAAQDAELKQARADLQQSQNLATESAAQLEARAQSAEQARDNARAKAQASEQALSKLQDELAAANRADQETAKAHGSALEQTQGALKKAQGQIADLQSRLDDAGRACQEALAANLKQTAADQEVISTLQARLEAAERQAAKLKTRLEEARTELELNRAAAESDAEVAEEPSPSVIVEPAEPAGENPSLPEAAPAQTSEEPASPAGTEFLPAEIPVLQSNPATVAAAPEAAAAPSSRPTKRKKSRRDLQMDLFAAPLPPGESAVRPELAAIDNDVADAWPIEPEGEPPAAPQPAAETAADAAVEPPAADLREATDFPEIKGLSTTEGLGWAGGNSDLYFKALREFTQVHAGTGEKIRAALEQGDAPDAEHVARALKSAAGDIGATALAESAAALARAIHDRKEPGELEGAWSVVESSLHELLLEIKAAVKPKEDKPKSPPAKPAPAPPPLNPAQFRKAAGLILPLLTDGDPGAKDCLKDNRNTFRSGFSAEAYADFEEMIKRADYSAALESLKKAGKKHGIPV